jgi:hypothetical protein
MSLGRPLTHQEWREFRGIVSLGLVVAMPVLMALPPRRFNGVALMQLGMLGWAANEQLAYRTGRDVVSWATGERRAVAAPLKSAAPAAEAAERGPAEAAAKEVKVAADAGAKRSRGREG